MRPEVASVLPHTHGGVPSARRICPAATEGYSSVEKYRGRFRPQNPVRRAGAEPMSVRIMPKAESQQRSPARVESLEGRTLLAWGAFPQLIDQDQAVSRYGQYNGSGQSIAVI